MTREGRTGPGPHTLVIPGGVALTSGGFFRDSRRQSGGPTSSFSFSSLVPVHHWVRDPALRSWPVLLLIALVGVPPIAVVLLNQPTASHLGDAGWIYAYYFATAWLLLLGVIVRPQHVTRSTLSIVALVGVVTQVPLALALESSLHSSNGNLFASVFTIGIPEEIAKAIPVLMVAWLWRSNWSSQTPRDYLFLGAVSGLVFGAAEAHHYFTSALGTPAVTVNGPVLQQVTIIYVWRFLTDPIDHACWAGITGYFIGLSITGTSRRRYVFGLVGIGIAALLHGLNDWSPVNGHITWIVVTLASVLLFLGYARAEAWIPQQAPAPTPRPWPAAHGPLPAAGQPAGPTPDPPAPRDAWWEGRAAPARSAPDPVQHKTVARPWWEQ
jgi:RsiW-degrading membrane proteinase PrsW (M82 family)